KEHRVARCRRLLRTLHRRKRLFLRPRLLIAPVGGHEVLRRSSHRGRKRRAKNKRQAKQTKANDGHKTSALYTAESRAVIIRREGPRQEGSHHTERDDYFRLLRQNLPPAHQIET